MTAEAVVPETLHVWAICLRAGQEARRRGDRRIGTDHLLLALFEDPSIDAVLGVNLDQAREALDSLDRHALAALGLETGVRIPLLPTTRAIPTKPRLRDVATKDRLRLAPAAKRVLEAAVKPNRRKTYVTTHQVLAQILALRSPDPAAALLDALGVSTADARRQLSPLAPDV